MTSSIETIAITPLLNFKIENDLVLSQCTVRKPMSLTDLDDRYKIRQEEITDWEQLFWQECPIFEQRFDPTGLDTHTIFSNPQILLNHLLNSIILYTPWPHFPLIIGSFTIRHFKNGQYSGSSSGGHISAEFTSPSPWQGKISLKQSQYTDFKQFFDMIYQFINKTNMNEIEKRIKIAYYWLQKSRENIRPYDRLIFLTAGLEALVSQNEGEMNYRISHRTSAILGENESERYSIYLTVKGLYDLRSRIVHGTPNIEVRYFETEYLLEIVRALILRFISLSQNGYGKAKRLFMDIDNSVFESSIRSDIVQKSKIMFGDNSLLCLSRKITDSIRS